MNMTQAWILPLPSCVMWNDNSTSWHQLADIKNSLPMQLAQYAISHKLDKETDFKWWIKPTLKHQDHFLKALKSKYSSRTHKFGIRVPTSVEEALAIDKETNTTYCEDIHRVNLPLYACGAMQLPPYQLLGSLEEFWMDT
jgi:hypothetical protein